MLDKLVKVRQIELPSDAKTAADVKCFMNRYSTPGIVKSSNSSSSKEDVDAGFLWLASVDQADNSSLIGATLHRSLEFDSLLCNLFPGDKKSLTVEQTRILLPLRRDERKDFCSSDSFDVARRCRVGSTVLVRDPAAFEQQVPAASLKCTLRFKDVLPTWTRPKDPDGLYFGFVSCDPKVDGQPMLTSVLPEADTRRLLNVRDEERNLCFFLADARWLVPDENFSAEQLLIGDRVVLKLDTGKNEYRRGVVRWLGRLDPNGPKKMAGVDFDHQIPNSDCWLNNRQLFNGKSGCCRIVNEACLEREEDFDHKIAENRASASSIFHPPAQSPAPQNKAFDQRRNEADALMSSRFIEIDSRVNVLILDKEGTVMWYGFVPDENDLIVGVAIDDEETSRDGHGLVPASRVLAVYPHVQPNLWFTFLDLIENANNESGHRPEGAEALPGFGNQECETIVGPTELRIYPNDLDRLIGRNRGVQGHHNSCYLDSTLFAMFATVDAFDGVLDRPAQDKDLENYDEIRLTLREGIVNCLRRNNFVSAQQVLKLRRCLNDLDIIPGMMTEEKDPEEFINLLLDHALRHEPFIRLNTGQSSHVLQLFLDRSDLPFEQQQQQPGEKEYIADTETLLHLSLIQSNIQLSEPPQCLILQMPRSGKSYKMFHRILPVLELNITNLLPDTARACAVCGKLATFECHQCFLKHDSGRDYTYCKQCFKTFSEHRNKAHEPLEIQYPNDIRKKYSDEKQYVDCQTVMDLLAVVCIRTSHYVCFLRAQPNDWLFFDSMADREGGFDNGYNIPEVTRVPGLEAWLDKLKLKDRRTAPPEQVNRLLEDCYLCFYGNPRVVRIGDGF